MSAPLSPATSRLLDYLGDLGPRWGLPAGACRLHGYLYVTARPTPEPALRAALALGPDFEAALAWLVDYRLVERADGGWQTDSDPWELVMRALEERRQRELGPALALLRGCRRDVRSEGDRIAEAQIGKLLALVEDIAAIDAQARRLSPRALRQMVGIGGLAARLIGRTFGRDRG